MTSSTNVKKRIIIAIVSVLLTLLLVVAVLAYYEYYGQYSGIINLDGSIRLDAFGVLYEELRGDTGYGTTPENPFVISNIRHFQNLIKLNNSGRLSRYKQQQEVEKYYFCLEFDEQTLPQVLNLSSEGIFSTIGNNEYPFEDELSGIVYAYEIAEDQIVYYSGCLDTVEVTIVDGYIYRDGVNSGIAAGQNDIAGTYLKIDRTYNYQQGQDITFTGNTLYVPIGSLTIVHQMIANATIVADTTQLDVGFFNNISTNGDVHDVILYNINVICQEDVAGTVHGNLFTLFADLLNGTTGTDGALTNHM